MDQIQLIFTARVLIVGSGLLAGSIMDIRTRRIRDGVWALLMFSCLPLLGYEMWLKEGSASLLSVLTLLLPMGGFLFVMYGYPEPGKILKGSMTDLVFAVIYLVCIAASAAGFLYGDPSLTNPVLYSSVFMLVYFGLYHIPIGGTRIIHGGADLKCLLVMAAVFPWYVEGLPYSIGPFYNMLHDNAVIGWIFPIHLSVLFNGALATTIVIVIILPIINIVRGHLSFPRMFTSYMMEVDSLPGKHVWVLLSRDGKVRKVEPSDELVSTLGKEGVENVWVTPKIPFIASLFIGFILQMIFGNIIGLIFLSV